MAARTSTPRTGGSALTGAVVGVLLALVPAYPARAAAEVDLLGSWHVLVHYQEPGSDQPELWRWQDRLWVFETEGERLRFSEFPIVAFDDSSGRFERGMNGQWIQVEGAWEPSPGQLAEIEEGLAVNARGVRSKTLRVLGDGRLSSARPGGYDSARFVVFEMSVEVDLRGEAPSFEMRDSLDSSAARGHQGVTRYLGERASENGRRIEGSYQRDGRQQGRFVMRRSGAARSDEHSKPEGSEKARVYDTFYRELGRGLRSAASLPDSLAGDRSDPAVRDALRAAVVAALEDGYRAQGNDPRPFAPQIAALAEDVVALYAEGRSRDEIGVMIQDGRLRP